MCSSQLSNSVFDISLRLRPARHNIKICYISKNSIFPTIITMQRQPQREFLNHRETANASPHILSKKGRKRRPHPCRVVEKVMLRYIGCLVPHTWVRDQARAASFDWDLHVLRPWRRRISKRSGGKRFREAMAISQGDDDATTTPSAAAVVAPTTTTPTSKIAGMAVASDYDSDGGDSDGKIRDDGSSRTPVPTLTSRRS